MKPTIKQKNFLLAVAKEITSVQNTNDINSPTHWSDNDETGRQLAEQFGLPEEVGDTIGQALSDIIHITQQLEPKPNFYQ